MFTNLEDWTTWIVTENLTEFGHALVNGYGLFSVKSH